MRGDIMAFVSLCSTMQSRFARLTIVACHAILIAGILLQLGSTGLAGSPTAVAKLDLPPPDHNAFSTSFRYDSQGILYAWDGFHVHRQNIVNSNVFVQFGTIVGGSQEPLDWQGSVGGDYNCADAGPINFSRDGQRILLGNGNGGSAPYGGPWFSGTVELQHSGRIWSMPISGGTVSYPAGTQPIGTINYHTDFIPVSAASAISGTDTKYFVNQGTDYTGSASEISIFDETTGINVPVVINGPGATTSLAFNPTNNRLYAGVGFGTNRGNIYSFTLDQIDKAFSDSQPLDFTKDGTLFNSTVSNNQSGAGLFFDTKGYLFAGGTEGITCFRPDGAISSNLGSNNQYTVLTYNAYNDQILAIVGNVGTIYNASDFETVPEPSAFIAIITGGLMMFVWQLRRKR